MNNDHETITISLDEHDVKSLITSALHQQELLNQQQNQAQSQQSQVPFNPPHITTQTTSAIPSTSSVFTTGSTTIPTIPTGRQRKSNKQASKIGPVSLDEFWPTVCEDVKQIKQVDAKNQNLPLARIKKIMKLDENAKMIAAEAPLLFAKACEYFIQELTLRAWTHTEENKRRTLQRSDIVTAISRCDQFDFLIDIVPREEIKSTQSTSSPTNFSTSSTKPENSNDFKKSTDQVQYLLQLGGTTNQPQQITLQQPSTSNAANLINQTIPLNQQALSGTQGLAQLNVMTPQNILLNAQAQSLVNSLQQQQAVAAAQQQNSQSQQIQLFQQIIGPNGEIQNVPITITPNQLGFLRIQGANTANTQQQPQYIIQQQPTLQVTNSGQTGQNQGIFLNQNALQQALNKGNVNITNFRTN